MNDNNIQIEKVILGTLISYPNLYYEHQSKLSIGLFTLSDHQILFDTIERILNSEKPLDVIILINELKKAGHGKLDKFVFEVVNLVYSFANFEFHLMLLVENYIKRDFITKFASLLQLAQTDEDIFKIREKAFEHFDNLFVDRFLERNKQNVSFPKLVDEVQKAFTAITNGESSGLKISLDIINKTTGGWQNSDLVIIAARPGMGKTAFMVQNIVDIAQQGIPVGAFSLEMSAEQITTRIITNVTGIPNSSFLRKGLNDNEIQTYFHHKDSMIELPIHIDDTPAISIDDLRVKAKMMVLKYGIKILFVDYLQLITNDKSFNREQEIGSISRKLKQIAKELNIPVIALSQLSRNVESRPNKRPQLSDLRDSGSIEADADVVGFLYRPEYYDIEYWDYYDNEPTENEVEIIIQKNRQGGLLSERCRVDLANSKFTNLSHYEYMQ